MTPCRADVPDTLAHVFTGIVEELGRVVDSRPVDTEWGAGQRIRIRAATVPRRALPAALSRHRRPAWQRRRARASRPAREEAVR